MFREWDASGGNGEDGQCKLVEQKLKSLYKAMKDINRVRNNTKNKDLIKDVKNKHDCDNKGINNDKVDC